MNTNHHKTWFRIQRRLKRSLQKSGTRRILGARIFQRRLWRSEKHAVAGGLALGLFVAFTPAFPFQMLLAAMGAVLFGVNLPIAVLACWVTNPLTVMPIYRAAWRCGRLILTELAALPYCMDLYAPVTASGQVIRHGLYLSVGSLVFATAASAIGYLAGVWLYGTITGRRRARSVGTGIAARPTGAVAGNTVTGRADGS